ncbi:GNAT family N-acetyltransferase [Psychrobacter sanguinis]|uniref:GNAT family N-acetyltransferase n=1 Tax=Psychrobacter sanguinis TaxID=861445 RepID=A0A844M384_9GAMM|nr:GNAT family N-acetyltransferase [Psychrobacter sanguinis]MUG33273.1 GNAT family N-acetyltransferase [Psychrobacter sanguinis]
MIIFETENLFLRAFTEEDLDEAISLFLDRDFMVFSPNGALNIKDATYRFYEILEHYEKYGFGKLAIIPKNTSKIIGYCGFETCLLDGRNEAELGFRLIKSERRKGYVIEAASKLIEDMKNRGFQNIIAFSEELNYPAHNLLKKLGFNKTFSSNFLNMNVVFFSKSL